MEKITSILLSEVETEDGEKLGRVFELRSAGDPEHGLKATPRRVTEVLFGKRAFLEMLGLRETVLKSVPMTEVTKIEAGKITIRNAENHV